MRATYSYNLADRNSLTDSSRAKSNELARQYCDDARPDRACSAACHTRAALKLQPCRIGARGNLESARRISRVASERTQKPGTHRAPGFSPSEAMAVNSRPAQSDRRYTHCVFKRFGVSWSGPAVWLGMSHPGILGYMHCH